MCFSYINFEFMFDLWNKVFINIIYSVVNVMVIIFSMNVIDVC